MIKNELNRFLLALLLFPHFAYCFVTTTTKSNPRTANVRPPSIDFVKRNFAFRSGGNDLVISFASASKVCKWQSVKLILFYGAGGDRNGSLTWEEDIIDAAANFTSNVTLPEVQYYDWPFDSITTPPPENGVPVANIETTCRVNSDRECEYLCPTPSIAKLFPNFTSANWEYDGSVLVVDMLQLGGCNGSNYNRTRLCFAVSVNGQLAPIRHQQIVDKMMQSTQNRRKNVDDEEMRWRFAIIYYPDPVLMSVTLMPPDNLLSISGQGLEFWKSQHTYELPQYEIIADCPKIKTGSIPIHCNTTYKNANENGFVCLFEPRELAVFRNVIEQVVMTIRFGNWSGTCNLTFGRPPWPGPGQENRKRRPNFFPPPRPPSLSISSDNESTQRRSGPGHKPLDSRVPLPPPLPPDRRPRPPWDAPRQGDQWHQSDDDITNETKKDQIERARLRWFDEMRSSKHNENVTASNRPSSVSSQTIVKIVVPICTVALFILACVALLCCLRRTPLQRTKFFTLMFPPSRKSRQFAGEEMQCFSLKLLPPEMVAMLSKHRIDKGRLLVAGNDLGEGFFGIVRSAIMNPPRSKKSALSVTMSDPEPRSTQNSGQDLYPQKVAIKTIQRYENLERMKEFFQEAIMMFSFQHPNVLSAEGFVDDLDGYPAIVLPLMDGGNLHEYVRTHTEFNDTQLYDFAWQIAKGMTYLASLKLVHRDLAARNCLLSKQLAVKVSDFGLTRYSDSVNYEYGSPEYRMLSHHRPLPIRWLAPECLESGTFTEKSDVWSFGVLLWELASRGARPYGDMESSRIVTFVRYENGRLPKMQDMQPELFELMTKCWKEHSFDRPTFEELADITKTLLDDQCQSDYCDPHLNVIVIDNGASNRWQRLEKSVSLNSQKLSVHTFVTNMTSLPLSVTTDDSAYVDGDQPSDSSSSRTSAE